MRNPMSRRMLKVLLGCCISPVAFAAFTLHGKPINPVCVWLLVNKESAAGQSEDGSSSNFPYFKQPQHQNILYTINLDACEASETAGDMSIKPLPGASLVKYDFPWGAHNDFNQKLRRGSHSYIYVGQTASGLDVLHVYDWGGGSGIFDSILFLKRQKVTQYTFNQKGHWQPQEFTSLSVVGSIPGGDRATGSFKTIRIDGNQLNVLRFNTKNLPVQPKYPMQKVVYPIPGVNSGDF